jgi:hypothetical protein
MAILSLGVCILLRVRNQGVGFFPSTQCYYRSFYYYCSLNCYMFRSYDHLHAEIYLLEITLLTPVYKAENTTVGISHVDDVAPSIRKSWHYLGR